VLATWGRVVTHVVTGNCELCRFTDCVTTCPVACFHGDEVRMYIDPLACIDCGACIPACPVHAIFEAIDLAEEQSRWLAINAEQAVRLPVISKRQSPLPTAEARRKALGY
jgi:ferredoxin